jgi:hypothetical protein
MAANAIALVQILEGSSYIWVLFSKSSGYVV